MRSCFGVFEASAPKAYPRVALGRVASVSILSGPVVITFRDREGRPNMLCLIGSRGGGANPQPVVDCQQLLFTKTRTGWVTISAALWPPQQPSRGNKCNRSGTHPTGSALQTGPEEESRCEICRKDFSISFQKMYHWTWLVELHVRQSFTYLYMRWHSTGAG